jgi:hypothetical protein
LVRSGNNLLYNAWQKAAVNITSKSKHKMLDIAWCCNIGYSQKPQEALKLLVTEEHSSTCHCVCFHTICWMY